MRLLSFKTGLFQVTKALLTSASFAVYRWEEALVAQAAVGTSQVLTVTVRADARLLTLINIW